MTNNPFVNAIIDIFADLKLWSLAIIVPIAGFFIIKDAIKYKGEDGHGRKEIKKSIMGTIAMAGGVYFLLWFIGYVVSKMAAAAQNSGII